MKPLETLHCVFAVRDNLEGQQNVNAEKGSQLIIVLILVSKDTNCCTYVKGTLCLVKSDSLQIGLAQQTG